MAEQRPPPQYSGYPPPGGPPPQQYSHDERAYPPSGSPPTPQYSQYPGYPGYSYGGSGYPGYPPPPQYSGYGYSGYPPPQYSYPYGYPGYPPPPDRMQSPGVGPPPNGAPPPHYSYPPPGPPPRDGAPGHWYYGTIKTFDTDKGFGFVDCPETYNQTGMDVFILKSQLSGHSVKPGDKVSFTVEKGNKGYKCAEVRVMPDGYQPSSGPVYYGKVKKFDHDKGFGFIQTESFDGKDVLLLRSHLDGLNVDVGDKLSFAVEYTDKGLKAVNMRLSDGPPPPQYGVPSPYGAPPPGPYGAPPGPYGGYGAPPPGGPPPQYSGAPPAFGQDRMYRGELKNFDDDKGFGFVACSDTRKMYDKDIFVLKSQFSGQQVENGDQVEFSIKISDKGPAVDKVTVLRGSGYSDNGYQPTRSDSGSHDHRAAPY